jgi:hypothetical protein
MRVAIRVAMAVLVIVGLAAVLWFPRAERPSKEPSSERRSNPPTPVPALAGAPEARHGGREPPPPAAPEARVEAPAADVIEVRGKVTDGAGAPVRGANVSLGAQRPGRVTVERYDVLADSGGEFRVPLPKTSALPEEQRKDVTLYAYAWATPGEETSGKVPPGPLRGVVEVSIRLKEIGGAWLTGRVVTQDGSAVQGAEVFVCDGTKSVAAAGSDGTGAFRARLRDGGTLRVLARQGKEGVAKLEGVQAAKDQDVDVGALVLSAAGEIAGRAVLPDDTPAPLLYLAFSLKGGNPYEQACADGDPGARYQQVMTDAEGRFSVRNLRLGTFFVQLATDKDAALVETGTRDARIVVKKRLIVLHVTDAEGRPLNAEWAFDERREDGKDGWSGAGAIQAGLAVLDFGRPLTLQGAVSTATLESEPLTITVPSDAWRRDVTVVLRPPPPKGTVRLRLRTPEGAEVGTYYAEAHPVEAVKGIAAGASWSSGPSKPLRPGRYVVDVMPGQGDFLPSDPGGPALAPLRLDVTVPGDEETVVDAVARPGGWLRVTVVAPEGTAPDRLATWVETDPGGEKTEVAWSSVEKKGYWTSLRVGPAHWFGRALAPARYVLSTGADGKPAVRTPFSIDAGRTTDVEVRLGSN